MKDDVLKSFALISEMETSEKLIKLGFGELQNIDSVNDFYFLPFQLLSQGFERLMKSMICIGHYNSRTKFPELKYLKGLGHDLTVLLNEILDVYFDSKVHPLLQSDKDFLLNNKELRKLLYILSEFGKYGRYYNYDIITGVTNPSVNPKELWSKYESEVIFSDKENLDRLLDNDLNQTVFHKVTRHFQIILERFVAGLCRQFTYGPLGDKGRQMSFYVSDFAELNENDLGNKDYRKQTTRFKEQPRKVHKRNFNDWVNRTFNPNYVSKRIRQKDYDGEWPFYVDEVVVECRYKNWCVITIRGCDYALNGIAKGRYKLESPHEAGMAIIGKPFTDFIQIARNIAKP